LRNKTCRNRFALVLPGCYFEPPIYVILGLRSGEFRVRSRWRHRSASRSDPHSRNCPLDQQGVLAFFDPNFGRLSAGDLPGHYRTWRRYQLMSLTRENTRLNVRRKAKQTQAVTLIWHTNTENSGSARCAGTFCAALAGPKCPSNCSQNADKLWGCEFRKFATQPSHTLSRC